MKFIKHTKTFDLPVPIEKLFPLFSPEGEKLWVPGWDYRNIMGTLELEEDYVFLTENHDHGSTEAIWLVKKFDQAASTVEFYKIEPGDKVGVIKVQCRRLVADRTEVEVAYKYTALSKTGEAFIAGFSAEAYEAFIGEWRMLLSTHFKLEEK